MTQTFSKVTSAAVASVLALTAFAVTTTVPQAHAAPAQVEAAR